MEFNGFGALMVFKDDRVNVACFDHVSFRALREHPDHPTLMMLKKPVLLKLAHCTGVDGTDSYDKNRLAHLIITRWQVITETMIANLNPTLRSVFEMGNIVKVPAKDVKPCGSTDAPRFGDADDDNDKNSDGSLTPKTPVTLKEIKSKILAGYETFPLLSKSEQKEKKQYEKHREDKMNHYQRKVKRSMGNE